MLKTHKTRSHRIHISIRKINQIWTKDPCNDIFSHTFTIKNQPNVGKCTNPMDEIGFLFSAKNWEFDPMFEFLS